MKILFFMGKGGVGKSTLSTLTAIYLAKNGNKVLLTSLDPAHNLAEDHARRGRYAKSYESEHQDTECF